jgi:hypothetical protein
VILQEKNPLVIPSTFQLLPASYSSLDGDPEHPQGSISPGKVQQVISVAEGPEQLNVTGQLHQVLLILADTEKPTAVATAEEPKDLATVDLQLAFPT